MSIDLFSSFLKNQKISIVCRLSKSKRYHNQKQFFLSLINETLNRLMNVAYFTKFDFKNINYKIKIREKKRMKNDVSHAI